MSREFVGQNHERTCPKCGMPYSYIETKRYFNELTGTR